MSCLDLVRVMKTFGRMGEVAGDAASICIKRKENPRQVYTYYLDELYTLMKMPGNDRIG